MKLLIQQNLIFDKNLGKMEEASRDIPREFISVIPFTTEIICDTPLEGDEYIPLGSTRLCELAYDLKWKGLHFNSNFNYKTSCQNRNDMLNDEWIEDIETSIRFLDYEHFFRPESETFIRPSNDLKYFSGEVMNCGEAAAFLKDALNCKSSGSYKLNSDTEIVLATPRNIQMEWRYFIIGGKIVSGSIYRRYKEMHIERENDPEVLKEAQKMADKWLPDDCVVMDLALVDDKLKVVEFNCINGSGYYDHDIRAIIKGLYDYHLN